jgi:hypothetical protein
MIMAFELWSTLLITSKQTPTFIAFDVNQLVIKETELQRQGEITIQQEIELP